MSLLFRRTLALSVLGLSLAHAAGLLVPAPANALALAEASQPAEMPPAGFDRQIYVDSRGCAYARIPVSGGVRYVPRLNAARTEVVCNLTPSRAAMAPDAPAAPSEGPGEGPSVAADTPVRLAAPILRTAVATCPAGGGAAQMRTRDGLVPMSCSPGMTAPVSSIETLPDGSRLRVVSRPPEPVAPAPVQVAAAVPAPVVPVPVRATPTAGAAAASAPVRAALAAPSPGPTPAPAMVAIYPSPAASSQPATAIVCPPGGTARIRLEGGVSVPVHCAPDEAQGRDYLVAHAGGAVSRVVISPAGSAPAERLAAAQARASDSGKGLVVAAAEPLYIPKGYKPAWSDGRLNPCRGPRDFSQPAVNGCPPPLGSVAVRP